MGYDASRGMMYLASTNLTSGGSNLYRLDISTRVASLIGATGSPGLLALAIDFTGGIYGVDGNIGAFVEGPAVGQLRPVVMGNIGELTAAKGNGRGH